METAEDFFGAAFFDEVLVTPADSVSKKQRLEEVGRVTGYSVCNMGTPFPNLPGKLAHIIYTLSKATQNKTLKRLQKERLALTNSYSLKGGLLPKVLAKFCTYQASTCDAWQGGGAFKSFTTRYNRGAIHSSWNVDLAYVLQLLFGNLPKWWHHGPRKQPNSFYWTNTFRRCQSQNWP